MHDADRGSSPARGTIARANSKVEAIIAAVPSAPGTVRAARPRATALALFAFAWVSQAIVAAWAAHTMRPLGRPAVPDVPVREHTGIGRLLFDPWQNWDGQWFLEVARSGYGLEGTAAFFPFYPCAIRGAAALFAGDELVAALAVSWLSQAVALVLLARLLFADFGASRATAALLMLVTFPTALFFHAAYSESLFLMLAVATLLCARSSHWLAAGALAFFAILTRSAGVALVPALAVEAWSQAAARDGRAATWKSLFAAGGMRCLRRVPASVFASLALALLALPALLGGFELALGDAWAFQEAQRLWERRASAPWTSLIDGVRVVLPGEPWTLAPLSGGFPRLEQYPGGFLESSLYNLVVAVFALGLAAVALRRLPPVYGAYVIAGLLVPLTTASQLMPLYSMPRFVAVLFPLFVALAALLEDKPLPRTLLIATFASVQGFAVARFAIWYWVA
jgi:hypothetical protein